MKARILSLAVAIGLSVGLLMPASAETTGATTATLTLTGGALSITVPTDAGSLGTMKTSLDGGTISGRLGKVVVSDQRSAAAGSGWVASAVATAFTPTADGPSIPASRIGYVAGMITKTGTATYTADDPTHLNRITPVVTATRISGDNTATWTPTIKVAVPGGKIADTYTVTITHSVL